MFVIYFFLGFITCLVVIIAAHEIGLRAEKWREEDFIDEDDIIERPRNEFKTDCEACSAVFKYGYKSVYQKPGNARLDYVKCPFCNRENFHFNCYDEQR